MRRVFKTRTFARWSRKTGLPDADLGGGLFKKRVPLQGRGKRGGARTILGSNLRDRWFFVFGFEKNERATVDARELAVLQRIAAALLAADQKALARSMEQGELMEICHEHEEEPDSERDA